MILDNFIVFEGIDGAGTSTQLNILKRKLPSPYTMFTAEPTNSPVGTFIRTLLKGDASVSPETMARLFAADRQEHITGEQGIINAVKSGKTVFCDRYIFSSFAYQNDSCGSALQDLVKKENESFPLPELVFYFVIDPEISLKRITGRSVIEIYEKKDILDKVAERYRTIFDTYKQCVPEMKIIEIDATQPVTSIEKNIWSSLSAMPIINMK